MAVSVYPLRLPLTNLLHIRSVAHPTVYQHHRSLTLTKAVTGKTIHFPLISNCFFQQIANKTGRKYTEQHEWIDVQGGIGLVRVTDHVMEDVAFAQLPGPDTELNQMGQPYVSCTVL